MFAVVSEYVDIPIETVILISLLFDSLKRWDWTASLIRSATSIALFELQLINKIENFSTYP